MTTLSGQSVSKGGQIFLAPDNSSLHGKVVRWGKAGGNKGGEGRGGESGNLEGKVENGEGETVFPVTLVQYPDDSSKPESSRLLPRSIQRLHAFFSHEQLTCWFHSVHCTCNRN